jgi:hypothetical protein
MVDLIGSRSMFAVVASNKIGKLKYEEAYIQGVINKFRDWFCNSARGRR